MNGQSVFLWAGAAAFVAAAYAGFGWPGVALAFGGLVFWLLLHFTRMLQILRKAANRPKGWVSSAVMLNAVLQPGMTLLRVIGLTNALGERLEPDAQALLSDETEIWKWSDNGNSFVICHFKRGKLVSHTLTRPAETDSD